MSEVLLFLTGHKTPSFGPHGLLGFQVALSVLTVSIATKIFRIGNGRSRVDAG